MRLQRQLHEAFRCAGGFGRSRQRPVALSGFEFPSHHLPGDDRAFGKFPRAISGNVPDPEAGRRRDYYDPKHFESAIPVAFFEFWLLQHVRTAPRSKTKKFRHPRAHQPDELVLFGTRAVADRLCEFECDGGPFAAPLGFRAEFALFADPIGQRDIAGPRTARQYLEHYAGKRTARSGPEPNPIASGPDVDHFGAKGLTGIETGPKRPTSTISVKKGARQAPNTPKNTLIFF